MISKDKRKLLAIVDKLKETILKNNLSQATLIALDLAFLIKTINHK